MILCRQIHVIVRQGFLAGCPVESLILRTSEQIDRIAPDLTLRYVLLIRGTSARVVDARVVVVVGTVAATDPRRDVIEGHLLDERRTVLSEVPPFEDENQARDEGRRAG